MTEYLLAVGSLAFAWLVFSCWVVGDRIMYDRRLRAVREDRGGRLSWRILARCAADAEDDPALGDTLARHVLQRDEEGVVAAAYGKANGWRQVEALRLLARAGYRIDLLELERLLQQGGDEVAAAAATVLADIPGTQSTTALLRGLRRGGSQTRWTAMLLERRVLPADLVRPLVDDAKPEVREAALRLLGSAPDRRRWIDGELMRRCNDPLPDVRAAAARALGQRGRASAEKVLVGLLHDPVWFVQVQAARALGRLGCAERAGEIVSLLASSEWWVRQAAKDALVALGSRVSADLVALLDHPDAFARNSLAEVLQNVGFIAKLVSDVQAAPPSISAHQSEQALKKVLLAGGSQFAAAVLNQMEPDTRARFDAPFAGTERATSPEARVA